MEEENTTSSIGETWRDLAIELSLLFCILRACGVINWKWYWVMSPLLILTGIGIITLIILGLAKMLEDEDN